MKTLLKLSLLAATLAAAVPATYAAAHAKNPVERRQALRARVADKLDLTPEQRAQLKASRAKTAEAVKAIRNDSSLNAEQKRAKVRETLQSARQTARQTLTPEQQTKLEKVRKHLRAKVAKAAKTAKAGKAGKAAKAHKHHKKRPGRG